MFGKKSSLLLVCGTLFSAFSVNAQGAPTPEKQLTSKNQWGLRADVMANDNYNDLMQTVGATLTRSKHSFYASALFGFATRDAVSPLVGTYLSYQYFPFKKRNCFNPYIFASTDIGKFTTVQDVLFVTPPDYFNPTKGELTIERLNANTTIGAGFETRFGQHFYSHLSLGAAVASYVINRSGRYAEPASSPEPTPTNSSRTHLSAELKMGLGYRF